jgi:hypothetical protein
LYVGLDTADVGCAPSTSKGVKPAGWFARSMLIDSSKVDTSVMRVDEQRKGVPFGPLFWGTSVGAMEKAVLAAERGSL